MNCPYKMNRHYKYMKYNPDKHYRHSTRLKGYDYSQAGAYFVTICAWQRECLFGEIVDEEMRLNDAGTMVWDVWHKIPEHFSHTDIDEFVVMPNHAHGIIVICHDNCRGEVSSPIPEVSSPSLIDISPIPITKQGGETPPLRRRILGKIVAYFKYQSAKQINQIRNTPGHPVWQRNYYEHIIRSEKEMNRIRKYIIENPMKWTEDEDNPANIICKDCKDARFKQNKPRNRAGRPRPYSGL